MRRATAAARIASPSVSSRAWSDCPRRSRAPTAPRSCVSPIPSPTAPADPPWPQITPAFVNEAFLLLSQSIIHVEKEDVVVGDDDEGDDDDDEAPEADAPAADTSSSQAGPGTTPSKPQRSPSAAPAANDDGDAKKSKKVAITYDKYMTIMQKVVYMLAEAEAATNSGMLRSAVVVQYLEDVEGELQDPEAMEQEEILIKKVLTKLVKVRPSLLLWSGSG